MVRWSLRLAATLLVLGLVAIWLAHTSSVRRAALGRAERMAATYGVVLRASDLRYDLSRLSVSLASVRLAATQSPDQPFFEAARLHIDLPRSVLRGALAVSGLDGSDVRVRIHLAADGTTNLPLSKGTTSGDPRPFPIDRISLARLSVDLLDERRGARLTLEAPRVDIGRDSGRVADAAGTIEWRGGTTRVTVGGGLRYDGRAVRLDGLRMAIPDAVVTTSGSIGIFARDPRLQLDLSGSGDLPAMARPFTASEVPRGRLAFSGTVSGALAAPDGRLRLESPALTWQDLTATAVTGQVGLAEGQVAIDDLQAALAGGLIDLSGKTTVATGRTTLDVSWRRLNTGDLAATLAPTLRLRPVGRASGTARVEGQGPNLSAWAIDARTSVAAEGTARNRLGVGGDVRLAVARGTWRLSADGAAGAWPFSVRLDGALDTTRLADSSIRGLVQSDGFDVADVVRTLVQLDAMDAPGTTMTGRGSAITRVAGRLAAPVFETAVSARDVVVGPVRDVAVDGTVVGPLGELTVAASLTQGARNSAEFSGTVRTPQSRLDGRLRARLEDYGPLGLADLRGATTIEADVNGPFAGMEARGTVRLDATTYRGHVVGDVSGVFRADARAVHAEGRADRYAADVRGDLDLVTRRARVEAVANDVDIARVLPDTSRLTGAGSFGVAVVAEGPIDRWEDGSASVTVPHLSATVADLPVALTAPSRLSYSNGVVEVGGVTGRVGDITVLVGGRIPARASSPPLPAGEALHADVFGDVASVLAALDAAGYTDTLTMTGEGAIAVRARVGGSVERPIAEANAEMTAATLRWQDLPPIAPVSVRLAVDGTRISITEASGTWQDSTLSVEGVVPLGLLGPYVPASVASALPAAAGPAWIKARTDAVTPAVLEPFLGAEVTSQLGGSVAASAAFEAEALTATAVRGELRVDRMDITVAGLPVTQSEPTRIVADAGVARIVAWQWQGPESNLRLGGHIDVVGQRAAVLLGGQVDLRLLSPFLAGTGVSTTGSLEPRVSIAGPLTRPFIEGELVLERGEMRLAEPSLVATGVKGLAILTPTGLRLTELAGRVNGGTLRGTGTMDYLLGEPPSGALHASLDGMALDFPKGLRSEVDAELDLAVGLLDGPRPRRHRVTGVVTMTQGAYREPIAVVTQLLSALRSAQRPGGRRPTPSSLDRLDLAVRVLTEQDIQVRNNVASLQMGADVQVVGTGANPALSGRATLREGGTLLLGNNRYTIDEGTIDFSNPDTIDPDLNVRARTRAGGEDVELTLAGTTTTLGVTLRSESAPELGEADIASLLLTGRRLEDIPGAEAQIVGEQVLGYLSGDVLGLAGRAIGLDAVRLGGVQNDLRRGTAAVVAQTDPTSRLTFVKSFGDEFEVTLSQGLRNAAQTWIVDYTPTRRLALRLVSNDDSLRSYELRHDVAIGGGAVGRRAVDIKAKNDRLVTRVGLASGPGVSEAALRSVLRVREGRPFDAAQWQQDRDRMEALIKSTGRLEARVVATVDDVETGVELHYEVREGPPTVLTVSGHDLPDATLARMAAAWSESIADEVLRDELEGIARGALAEQGYLEAAVDVAVTSAAGAADPPDDAAGTVKTADVHVVPGPRTTRLVVQLEPADHEVVGDIERAFGRSALTELAQMSTPALSETLTAALVERGYLQGAVSVADPVVTGPTRQWVATLAPGPRATVGRVQVETADAIGAEVLERVERTLLVRGTALTPTLVERARTEVLGEYRKQGFAKSAVDARIDPDPSTGRTDVSFAVTPGRRQMLRRVVVAGNRAVRSEEILRALRLDVDKPLGHDAWLTARARVFETGLFSRVDVSVDEIEGTTTSTDTGVAATVTVQEWPAVRLRYGLQVSEEWRGLDPLNGRNLTPGLSADATRRSLFGRAVTIGAAATYRNNERLGRLFASAPTLWGRAVESLVSFQYAHTQLGASGFIADVSGLSWEQRAHLSKRVELGYSYRFERNHSFDPDPDPFLPSFDSTQQVARLVGTAAYDSRNDPLNATRGTLLSSSFEYAPQLLGSTSGVTFVKSLSQVYHIRPWRRVVLASAVRIGLAKGLGGVDIIPSEQFRTGGARSLRGVAEESLGPRSALFGDIIGGNALVVLNQELRFPVFRWLGGVAFADVGNVFEAARQVRARDLVGSSGVGARLATPFGLLRVDYGRLWSPRDNQTSGRWSFGIGQAF